MKKLLSDKIFLVYIGVIAVMFALIILSGYFSETDDNLLLKIAFILASILILKNYVKNKKMLADAQRQNYLLETLTEITHVLLSENKSESFKSSVLKSCEQIGHFLNTDRILIWKNETINNEPSYVLRYKWFNNNEILTEGISDNLTMRHKEMVEYKETFLRGECVNSPVSEMPNFYRGYLSDYGAKTIAIVPIFTENGFWGLLSVENCLREIIFSNGEMELIKYFGLMTAQKVNQHTKNKEIKEAEKRAQIMFDAMPFCANFWSKELKHIDCNEEAPRMFELQSKKEYSENFHKLSPKIQPDGKPSEEKALELVKKAFDEGFVRFDWLHQKLNGEPIPCEITLVRVKQKDDFIVAGYTRDLREQKTVKQKVYFSEQ